MVKSLKVARLEVDIKQNDAAEMLKISACYLSMIENHHKKAPDIEAKLWAIIQQRRDEMEKLERSISINSILTTNNTNLTNSTEFIENTEIFNIELREFCELSTLACISKY